MTMEVIADVELIQLMSNRQEEALVELHRRYAPYLTAVARRMLNDSDEVQQCVQDAFVNAWDYAERFDDKKASAKTWLVEQELVDLAFYQGHSHGQVAELTGKPLGTVKSRLRGALSKLKETLKGGEA